MKCRGEIEQPKKGIVTRKLNKRKEKGKGKEERGPDVGNGTRMDREIKPEIR
jgi:hypothetical protein